MTPKIITATAIISIIFLTQCNQPQSTTNTTTSAKDSNSINSVKPRPTVNYHALSLKDSGMAKLKSQYDTNQQHIIFALNRADKAHGPKIDTLIVPDQVLADMDAYSPFPQSLPFLNGVNKMIFFSYPAQAFGAYEHGRLVRWGPTSMGRKKDATPTGLTYVNWKKEVDTSSVKDEWILKWNVNVFNKEGVGFHEYDLPGYPASHSCLRLLDNDAEYLYKWVDEWKMQGQDKILAHGTPVMIFGSYPFGGRKPWLALLQNPKALDISADQLQTLVQPNLQQILAEQQKLAQTEVKK